MGDLSDAEKELEKERGKLNQLMNEARKNKQPNSKEILEQSRKVDELLTKVQKGRLPKQGKTDKPKNGRADR